MATLCERLNEMRETLPPGDQVHAMAEAVYAYARFGERGVGAESALAGEVPTPEESAVITRSSPAGLARELGYALAPPIRHARLILDVLRERFGCG